MSTGDRLHHRDRKSIVSDRDRQKAIDRIIQTPDLNRYNRIQQRWMV